ncbi:MAG TPA: 2OG-Fe(II) oxygenase [Pyrinomonadaceae bacterium]|jgi:SM-20-related protein|nr:2OG-Fe(II) oxygenase [Pyrinomonadaceae bacterium]
MTTFDPPAHFGLFVKEGFFDERTCQTITDEMRLDEGSPATLYGRSSTGAIDERVRKSTRYTPSSQTAHFVSERLLNCKSQVEEHFGVSLRCVEEPQFLRYGVGDFFVAHQDGNTGLLRMDQESRLVSVVILLSRGADVPEENAYCGGALLFHDRNRIQVSGELSLTRKPGTFVAFRSETTHEVTPVTSGERCSIASWYR